MSQFLGLYKQETSEGVAQGTTSTTIILQSDASSANDYYKNWKIKILSGDAIGEIHTIISYNGSTKTATISGFTTFSESQKIQYLIFGILNEGDGSGILISENTEIEPLTIFNLNASIAEVSEPYLIAIRTEIGYRTVGNTEITFSGANANKWQISTDGITYGEWGEGITIADVILSYNKLLYIKAKATADEGPSNDISVNINVSTEIGQI